MTLRAVRTLASASGLVLLLGALLVRLIENEAVFASGAALLGMVLLGFGVFGNALAGYLETHRRQMSEETVVCVDDGLLIRRPGSEARIRFCEIDSVETDVVDGVVVHLSVQLTAGYRVLLGGDNDLAAVERHIGDGLRRLRAQAES